MLRVVEILGAGATPWLLVAALALAHAAQANPTGHILYHEPVRLLPPTTHAGPAAEGTRLAFDALGRRFEFVLEPNRSLQRRRTLPGYRLLRGRIDGLPESWVRLTRRGRDLMGMFFDGQELYAIEPWAEVAGQSVTGGDNSGETNVVYRLRDVLLPAGAASCGPAVPSAEIRGDVAFAELGEELAGLPALQAQGANRRIELRAVADYEAFQQWGSAAESEVLSRMNIVDGIFSEQLALEISVTSVEVFETATDPFTTSEPATLLDEVADYRQDQATGEGLTHLFSGRNLDGTTRGIAYLGAACMFRFGVAVSQQRGVSLTTGALITAHEIGHNLNAQHDGEPTDDPLQGNPCESVQQDYLMAPTISSNSNFSQCSIDVMSSFIDTLPGSCISPAGPQLDDVPSSLATRVATPVTLAFAVVNDSRNLAPGTEVRLTYPAMLDLQPQNVACNLAAGWASCNLGDLADGQRRSLSFAAQAAAAGEYSVDIALATDITPDSDRATVTISVQDNPVAQGGTGGGGGGGGGATAPWSLAGLLVLAAVRQRRASRR